MGEVMLCSHKHADPSPVKFEGWLMLMTLTATDLTTNPSEECPQVDHAIFYSKTCHYLSQAGTLAVEGMTPLSPPLLGKAIKLSFSTSPKTLSLRFGLGTSV